MTTRVNDLVLLHGWGSAAAIWEDLARRLAPRFRVHALPLPGYGAAGSKTEALEGAAALAAAAAPRRCGVVGWSLGGEIALAWARRAPRQVQRLALVGTTPCFVARSGWPCGTPPAVLKSFGESLEADRAGTLARFTALQAKGDSRARAVATVLKRYNARHASMDALTTGLSILAGADLRRDLPRVGQPALVLHGARDRVVPPAAGRRLAALLPNARYAPLRTCAHAPFVAQPARVARALRAFFDE